MDDDDLQFEEVQLQLVELDKELEMMYAENEVYENFFRIKTQVRADLFFRTFLCLKVLTDIIVTCYYVSIEHYVG